MCIAKKILPATSIFIETCVSPSLRFDGLSCSTWTWSWCRIIEWLLRSYLWWACWGILNATEKPSLNWCWRDCNENRKRRRKTPKITIESQRILFWVFLSEIHRGPLQPQNLMSEDRLRTQWKSTKGGSDDIKKVMGGMRRVPNGTWKAFDNLSKLSCKLKKQENFRVQK